MPTAGTFVADKVNVGQADVVAAKILNSIMRDYFSMHTDMCKPLSIVIPWNISL